MLADSKSNADRPSFASDGTSRRGTDGYSDIGRDTQVTVKNGKGEILAVTSLGQGHGGDFTCDQPLHAKRLQP